MMLTQKLRPAVLSLCLVLGLSTLLIALIPPQTASAKDEKYKWTGANSIDASGGNYLNAITLKAKQSGGRDFTGTIVMGNTKCNRTVDLKLDQNSNTKATIRVYTDPAQSAGQNCGPTTGPFGAAYDSPVTVADPNNVSGNRTGEGSNTETNDPTNTTGEETAINGDSDVCPVNETSALRWIICPLVEIGDQTIGSMQGFVMKFLFTPVDPVFDGIQKSADSFRNVGLGLLALAALFMIVSSAFGFEIFDAYAIKKILPRILVAAIGIALAFPLLRFAVGLTNDLGILVGNIIVSSVDASENGAAFGDSMAGNLFGLGAGAVSTVSALVALGAVGAAAAGFSAVGVLALMGSIILALLIGLLVLGLRQAVIMVCVLFAPIAIAAYILPGTQKIWAFWKTTLITTLAMFPIIMAFIASGTAMSNLLGSTAETNESMAVLALIVRYAPYFMIPFAFKLAGGLMSTIFSIANDRGRGLFDRSKNFRAGQRQMFADDLANGRGRAGNNFIGSGYRRLTTRGAGGLSRSAAGKAKWQASEEAMRARAVEAGLKNDDGRAFMDTDATRAAVHATSASDFVGRYQDHAAQSAVSAENKRRVGLGQAKLSDTEEAAVGSTARAAALPKAQKALGALEIGMGGKSAIGTRTLQAAAFKALGSDTTGYDHTDEGLKKLYADAGALVSAGTISEGDAAQVIKGNRARTDQSATSYGDVFSGIAEAVESGGISPEMVRKLRKSAVKGMKPGELSMAHPNAVKALAPEMKSDLVATLASGDGVAIDRKLASIAGKYDAMGQFSEESAEVMATELMSQTISAPDGTQQTVQQLIESRRSAPGFLEMRREYGRQEAAARGGMGGGGGQEEQG